MAASKQKIQKQEREARQLARQSRQALLAAAPINLSPLQTDDQIRKATQILTLVAQGTSYRTLGGKRWESDRTIVVVPVGRRFRLLFRDDGARLTPIGCLTHEAYNKFRPESAALRAL